MYDDRTEEQKIADAVNKHKKWAKPTIILALAFFAFLILNPIVVIGAGNRGVVFSNAVGIKEQVLTEGVHLKTPFVESIKQISVRTQQTENIDLVAGDSSNQTITYKTTVGWHIDPARVQKFYQQIGDDDKKKLDKIITNRGQEAVKTATAQFKAEDVLAKQQEIKVQAHQILSEDLLTYNLVLDDIVFTDIDFTDQYNKALEDRAQAKIQADQAIYLKQKAQNEADAQLVTASASARATIIAAEAESRKQQLLQTTITDELLQKMAIEKWDGRYPTTTLGTSVPLIQVGR